MTYKFFEVSKLFRILQKMLCFHEILKQKKQILQTISTKISKLWKILNIFSQKKNSKLSNFFHMTI